MINQIERETNDKVIAISAKKGVGIKRLNEKIVNLLDGSTITSSIGKQLFKLGVQGLKALGWLGGPFGVGATATLAGTIAASITYGFGWACNAYYKSGMTLNLGILGKIYKEYYDNYYSTNREVAVTKIKTKRRDTNKKNYISKWNKKNK